MQAVGAFTGFVSAAVCAILCCSTLMLLGLVAVASYVAVGFAVVAGASRRPGAPVCIALHGSAADRASCLLQVLQLRRPRSS